MSNLRIVFGVGYYFPDSYGGTEQYVQTLAESLQQMGHTCMVIAPCIGSSQKYTHHGVEVYRFVYPPFTHAEIVGETPPANLSAVVDLLKSLKADVFHLHSTSPPLGLVHLQAIRTSGINTVFTGHVPGVVCPRADMMRNGKTPCDGIVEWQKCSSCLLQQRGYPSRLAYLLTQFFYPFLNIPLIKKFLPVLYLAQRFQHAFSLLNQHADQVVSVCQWLQDALQSNGVHSNKLQLVRQVPPQLVGVQALNPANKSQSGRLRIGFIGRIAPIKGLHELIEAFIQVSSAKLELSIVGNASEEHTVYEQRLNLSTQAYPNIRWEGKLSGETKTAWFRTIDLLCIPSVWLETGPIVALEALVHQVPVMGRNLGGLKELINESTGYLYNSKAELQQYLYLLAEHGVSFLPNITDQSLVLITPSQQAQQMLDIYTRCLESINETPPE